MNTTLPKAESLSQPGASPAVTTSTPSAARRTKPKNDRLTLRQLAKVSHELLNLSYKLRMAAKEDGALKVSADKVNAAWTEIHDLVNLRELAEAKRKDARLPEEQRECWTLYFPREYGWESRQYIIRTAHTRTDQSSSFGKDVHTCAADPASAWSELGYQLESYYPKFDLEKFRKHAARVDEEWKRHRFDAYEEAA